MRGECLANGGINIQKIRAEINTDLPGDWANLTVVLSEKDEISARAETVHGEQKILLLFHKEQASVFVSLPKAMRNNLGKMCADMDGKVNAYLPGGDAEFEVDHIANTFWYAFEDEENIGWINEGPAVILLPMRFLSLFFPDQD